jgi:Ca2+-transporting ATPase
MTLKIGSLCNNATIQKHTNAWTITGDPTEAALIVAARKAGIEKEKLEKHYQFVWEKPFDAQHKTMSVLRANGNEGIVCVKGAPDIVLKQSAFLQNKGTIDRLSPQDIQDIEAAMHELARQGLRLIAVAYKKVDPDAGMTDNTLESDLIFTGFFALADAPRPEVFQAIKECKSAGIRIVMITGDHKETALKIASDLGIVEKNARALDGNDLEKMSDRQLAQEVSNVSVYARVLAQHKVRLVKAFKTNGLVVAMTGDGVNDAPAVKAADIGIAMGITGTDVTKEVADIIITDDNFASIIKAIRYGRGIYENIVKSVCYLISANMAELLVVFFTMFLHLGEHSGQLFVGLLPIQLIWVNLITDGIPALALSVDKTNDSIMTRMPRPRTEPIFSRLRAIQSLLVSICIAIVTVGGGWYGLQKSMALGYTMALTILITLELVRAQTVRSEYNLSFFSNKWLVGAFVASFFVHLGVLYTKIGNKLLQTVPLALSDWGVVIFCTVVAWSLTTLGQRSIAKVYRQR